MPGKNDPRIVILDAVHIVDQMLKTEPLKDVAMTLAAAIAVCAHRMGGTQEQQTQFVKIMAMTVVTSLQALEKGVGDEKGA